MTTRTLHHVIESVPTSDGAGVKLRRSLGRAQHLRLDPFLMLDEFSSDNAEDYIAGFPNHPHRGFETVTYMLDGHMLHEDHMGNRGDLKSGDVQWMTAGRGIIHSEMPERADGRLRGFQLWVNLPGALKMSPPRYQDVPAARIATVARDGASVRVIAGEAFGAKGAANTLVPVRLLDVTIAAASDFTLEVPDSHACFVYAYEGTVRAPDRDGKPREIARGALAVLEGSGGVTLTAGSAGAKLLFADGQPIREPIARYGPFVMNTREQIQQAIADVRTGRLGRVPASTT